MPRFRVCCCRALARFREKFGLALAAASAGWCPPTGLRAKIAEALRSLRDVFRNPGLRRIQLAFAGSIVGDWAYGVAVAVYAYDQGGATAVGVLGVIRYVSLAIATPFGSVLGDRYPRRLVMVASDVTRAGLVLSAAGVVAAGGPAPAVYVLTVLAAVCGSPFRSAQASLLPELARGPADLSAANVASSTVESVGFFGGPALAGLMLTFTSIQAVFVFNALTFVWSAALVLGVRVPLAWRRRGRSRKAPRRHRRRSPARASSGR